MSAPILWTVVFTQIAARNTYLYIPETPKTPPFKEGAKN